MKKPRCSKCRRTCMGHPDGLCCLCRSRALCRVVRSQPKPGRQHPIADIDERILRLSVRAELELPLFDGTERTRR